MSLICSKYIGEVSDLFLKKKIVGHNEDTTSIPFKIIGYDFEYFNSIIV